VNQIERPVCGEGAPNHPGVRIEFQPEFRNERVHLGGPQIHNQIYVLRRADETVDRTGQRSSSHERYPDPVQDIDEQSERCIW
jgi:hypothetical protein